VSEKGHCEEFRVSGTTKQSLIAEAKYVRFAHRRLRLTEIASVASRPRNDNNRLFRHSLRKNFSCMSHSHAFLRLI
jgi:hypothetical protein